MQGQPLSIILLLAYPILSNNILIDPDNIPLVSHYQSMCFFRPSRLLMDKTSAVADNIPIVVRQLVIKTSMRFPEHSTDPHEVPSLWASLHLFKTQFLPLQLSHQTKMKPTKKKWMCWHDFFSNTPGFTKLRKEILNPSLNAPTCQTLNSLGFNTSTIVTFI